MPLLFRLAQVGPLAHLAVAEREPTHGLMVPISRHRQLVPKVARAARAVMSTRRALLQRVVLQPPGLVLQNIAAVTVAPGVTPLAVALAAAAQRVPMVLAAMVAQPVVL